MSSGNRGNKTVISSIVVSVRPEEYRSAREAIEALPWATVATEYNFKLAVVLETETAIRLERDPLTDKELPVITPSEKACVMCEDVPCTQACNDRALVLPSSGGFPAIGRAVVRMGSCLVFNGSTCMVCFDACPLKRLALRFQANKPVVYEDHCTGCGQCEYICPADEKGIAISS